MPKDFKALNPFFKMSSVHHSFISETNLTWLARIQLDFDHLSFNSLKLDRTMLNQLNCLFQFHFSKH